ncbi:MAG: VOC family protein [Congregibacter sp.]
MSLNNTVNYVEFAASDLEATKRFFVDAFGWVFEDFGPDYTAFAKQGVEGGFYRADMHSSAERGGALVVLYSDEIEKTQIRVEQAGGKILQAIFSFPGGRRFHFAEPSGNELAVWTDIGVSEDT